VRRTRREIGWNSRWIVTAPRVQPQACMNPFHHVLVAVDFGPSSERALELAMKLVEGSDARLTLVHVAEVPPLAYAGLTFSAADIIGAVEEAAAAQLAEKTKSVRARIPNATYELRTGAPWEAIVDVAATCKADAIVVGTHGRRGISHAVLGSVAEKVVRLSKVPVITVRGED